MLPIVESRRVAPPAPVRCAPGGEIVVRPQRRGDEALTRAFFESLSREATYQRLLSARRLRPQEIGTLTRVDPLRQTAYVALSGGPAHAQIIGDARYVRDALGDAEFAIVVADAWQRRGIASLLLEALLQHARAGGVARLYGLTLASNVAVQGLALKLGFALRRDARDATLRWVEGGLASVELPRMRRAPAVESIRCSKRGAGASACALR